ncbi:MAG: threonine--tRNA ligase [Candidatus Saccharibacteria bacterium]
MNDEQLQKIRHSLSHLMSMAVIQLYPNAGLGVGPAIDKGFYQDYDLPDSINPNVLLKLENKIKELIKQDIKFEQHDMSFDEAYDFYKNDPYKTWFIDDLKSKGETKVSFYKSGDFDNLCSGPHITVTSEINPDAFKLTKIAGAYWRGDEKNKMLQRIYGVAFETKEDMDKYLESQEQAKLRDHRRLGQELDLFTFSDLVGAGLPMYTPRGTVLIDQLKGMLREISKKYDMLPVSIPHLAKIELYETSGHAAKFSDELFCVKSHYDQEFILKPVNCPHHTQIYASNPRSYRDLPLRYIEQTMQYRDEKPGAIGGLQRTRGFTVDDGHTFCRPDQIEQEASMIVEVVKGFYENLGLWGNHWVSLSVSDPKTPEKYIGDPADWTLAEKMLADVADKYKLDAKKMEGEAALYGPKIDFMFQDALGRETQLATIQLDFAMPKRFELKYTDSEGIDNPPVMIHRAILGSFERFIMLLIEHYGGWFPFWLAPEQIRILTINDKVSDYVDQIKDVLRNVVLMKPIKYGDVRFSVDDRNESLGKKIREATNWKIPVQIIVGQKDKDAREVSIRTQSGEEKIKLDELTDYLQKF